MSNHNPEQPPDPLKETLARWQVETSLPPGFKDLVWRRIEAETTRQGPVWSILLNRLIDPLRQPQFAAAYLAVVLLGGIAGGLWQGERKIDEWNHEQANRYLTLVDPLQRPTGK